MADVATYVAAILLVLLFITFLVIAARMSDMLNAANRKLELLMKHSGMNVHEVAIREVQPLVRAGKKIDAIKRYRELTGAGLAEAKTAVERMLEGAGPA